MPRPFVYSFVSFKYNTLPSYSYYNRFYVGKFDNISHSSFKPFI